MSTAFVAVANVDDRKKRFVIFSISPAVLGLFFAAFVIPARFVLASSDVVICLPRIGCVIPCLSEKIRIVADLVVRNDVSASHRLRSIGYSVHTSDPAGSGWGTYRSVVKTVQIAEPLFCKLVNRRCFGIGATIAPNP